MNNHKLLNKKLIKRFFFLSLHVSLFVSFFAIAIENVTFSHHDLVRILLYIFEIVNKHRFWSFFLNYIYSTFVLQDHRIKCTEDIDYQSSVDTLNAHWNIPSYLQNVAPDMHISIEEQSALDSNVFGFYRQTYMYILSICIKCF